MKHPSYGMIRVSRVSGYSRRLFGSPLAKHDTCFRIQICEADFADDDGSRWYRGRDRIVEVTLSAAQFVEMMTALNVGDGVPCTITAIRGADGAQHRVPEPPMEQTEPERVASHFRQRWDAVAGKVAAARKTIDAAIVSAKVSKRGAGHIREAVRGLVQEVNDNLPYMLDLWQEATDRLTSHAKAEIDAMLTLAVQRAGFRALKNGHALPLGEGGEDE